MNGKRVMFLVAWLGLGVSAYADKVVRMRMLPPVDLRKPVLTDTVNVKGKKPEMEKMLLESQVPLGPATGTDAAELKADGDGFVQLARVDDGYRLYVLNTALRANRFTKATLKVKSPVPVEVYVNDEKKTSKQGRQDSLKAAGECSVQLRMEPEVLYRVAVKVLASDSDKCAPAVSMEWNTGKDSLTRVACEPELKGRYLLPNTVYGNRVSDVSISPDGKYLLTRYTNWYNASRSNTYTQLSEVKSGRVLATYTRGAAQMVWMPRSPKMYYTVQSEKGMDIIVVDPATLQEETVARDIVGVTGGFRWSPDEKFLYLTMSEQIAGDEGPVRRVLSPRDRSGAERWRGFIARYDLKTGLCERLTYGLRSSHLSDISEDGRYMLFSVHESTPDKWPFGAASVYMMDLQTLKVDTLVRSDAFAGGGTFSPDGRQVLFTGGPESFGGIGKNCGRHPIANNYDTQAFLMDLSTRKIEPITRDFNPTVSLLQWNRYDGCIYFKTSDADREPVYRYNPRSRKFDRLPLEGDCISRFSLAVNAPHAAYTSATASTSTAGYLYDVKSGKSKLIADPYAENLAGMEMGEIKDWTFKASDGTEISGYYCLPPAFDPNKKYPLIVYYYGGTTPTTRSMGSPYAAQLFASRNYVVYVVNPSGTIGFGQEFSARHVNAWGQRTADDIIEGTRNFCRAHSYVDSTRIGCLGASYGGFMTQYLQTQTNLFAAAASHAGISNVTSYWGEGYWGVGYNAVAAAQSYPWNAPELFTKQGSLFNADKINTPLLLLHGTADTNVPIGESIQLYNALKVLGKTVEFIEVEGENHFISDYPKRVLWHNSIMAWFARWLQDSPEWWNDIYPERRLK